MTQQHLFEAILFTAIACFGVYIILMGHPNTKKQQEVTNGEENDLTTTEETDLQRENATE